MGEAVGRGHRVACRQRDQRPQIMGVGESRNPADERTQDRQRVVGPSLAPQRMGAGEAFGRRSAVAQATARWPEPAKRRASLSQAASSISSRLAKQNRARCRGAVAGLW
jgi:hypothetical protein